MRSRPGPFGAAIVVAGFLAFLLPTLRPLPDADLWWHLRAGQDLLAGHPGAFVESWSFTAAGARWVNHEWLAEAILAVTARLGGEAGVILLGTLLTLAIGALLVRVARRGEVPWGYIGAALALAALAAGDRFVARPQIFTLLLLALTLERFQALGRGKGSIWLLPILQLVWTNLHGPVIGLGVMTLLLLAGGLPIPIGRRLLAWGCVIVASMVHPCGAAVLVDTLRPLLGGSGLYRTMIREWQPILSPLQSDLPQRPAALLVMILAATLAVAGVVRPDGRRRIGVALLLAGFALAPLSAVRHRDLLAVAFLPAAAILFAPAKGTRRETGAGVPLVVGAGVAAAALVVLARGLFGYAATLPPRLTLDRSGEPVEAVDFLRRESLPGMRLFNLYDAGGFLVHELPAARVFVDGRYFVYGEERIRNYLEIRDGAPDARERLRASGANALLLAWPRGDGYMALARQARSWPEWALVHWDDSGPLFVRRDAVPSEWLARHDCPAFDPTIGSMPEESAYWREQLPGIVRECLRMGDESPHSARPRLALAAAFEQAGRLDDAAFWYGEVLRLFPAHRIAREGITRTRGANPAKGGSVDDYRKEFGLGP